MLQSAVKVNDNQNFQIAHNITGSCNLVQNAYFM